MLSALNRKNSTGLTDGALHDAIKAGSIPSASLTKKSQKASAGHTSKKLMAADLQKEILAHKEHIIKKTIWMYGGDGHEQEMDTGRDGRTDGYECLNRMWYTVKEMQGTSKPLIVGTEPSFPPFEMAENDTYTGFDIDLANAIGEKLGYEK